MENEIIRNAAHYLAKKMNRYIHKEGLELRKMELGAEIALINVSKLIIIYALAATLGTLIPTLITHVSFMLIKRYSFGLHALNSTVCTVVSIVMFVFIPLLLSGAEVGNFMAIAVFACIIFILYRYAPADTQSWPLIGKQQRATHKKKAVACGILLMAIAFLIPDGSIKLLLSLGAVYQSLAILPLSYKILKRSERNYEAYERT